MKKKSNYIILLIIFTCFSYLSAQDVTIVEKNIYDNDTIVLRLNDYIGDVQWEVSADNENWSEISGANSDTLLYIPNSSVYLRAQVTVKNCRSYYSDVAHITISDFTCGSSTITDYDNNIYNTVKIGNQCWMAENINSTHYTDGTPLTDGTGLGNIENDVTSKYWFVYNDDIAFVDTFGLLYTWAAVMNGNDGSDTITQGICPDGWHVPTDNEWKALAQFISDNYGPYFAEGDGWMELAHHLMATEGWNQNGTDDLGFKALPGGRRKYTGVFDYYKNYAVFSSSSKLDNNKAFSIQISFDYYHYANSDNEYAQSVRCIKD